MNYRFNILMKPANKNKTSPSKKTFNPVKSHSHERKVADSGKNSSNSNVQNWAQEYVQFHLNDEDPDTINAKRKLEEFSVELADNTLISPYEKNQQTINLLRKNLRTQPQSQQKTGWQIKQNHSNPRCHSTTQTYKKARILSASHCSVYQASKVKTQRQKKHSLSTTNPKLNLSFNNLLPMDMEVIKEKQILNKIKSNQSNRPSTAVHTNISLKMMSLSDREQFKVVKNSQGVRIHSGKHIQEKQKGLATFKDRDKFLKTCSFNGVMENNQKTTEEQQFLTYNWLNPHNSNNIEQNTTKNELKQKLYQHRKLKSEPIIQEAPELKENAQNQKPISLTHRKNKLMDKKRTILDKKIKSHQLFRIAAESENNQTSDFNDNLVKDNFQREQHIYPNKVEISYVAQQKKPQSKKRSLKENQNKISKKTLQAPTPNSLDQDFTLLINMLKKQTQSVFGGQLHSYLNHMKNNYQYNCYHSSGLNKKKTTKNSLHSTINTGKTLGTTPEGKAKVFVGEQESAKKTNRTLHYTSLSSSKHKDRGFQQTFYQFT